MDRLHPVKRRCGIGKLAHAIIEAALTAADTAKIEAQRGKPAGNEGFVHRLGNPVIHRAACLRMRVEDHGDRRARA